MTRSLVLAVINFNGIYVIIDIDFFYYAQIIFIKNKYTLYTYIMYLKYPFV